jgi:osmoprotectant transport system permease protein
VIDWGWLSDHLGAIAYRTGQHLYLTAIAVVVGLLISLVLGILAVRRRRLYTPVNITTGLLFTIPSLAMFAALVPIVGLNLLTAEIPLVMYTLVILFRNVVAGFDAVPADVLEAADGLAVTGRARLGRVELPLATPLIVAGVRVATVSTIGLVTITATLGDAFGGLGFFIYEGARTVFPTEILAGAVPVIALALVLDRLFAWLGARLTPWSRAAARPTAETPMVRPPFAQWPAP